MARNNQQKKDALSLRVSDSIGSGLVTLAFLTSWSDEPDCVAGHLDIFAPLVTSVLLEESQRGLRVPAIQGTIERLFGLSLPGHIVSKVLSILVREGIVLQNGKSYTVVTGAEVKEPDLLSRRQELLECQNGLVRDLTVYCGLQGHGLCEEGVRGALASFLMKNCSVYVSGVVRNPGVKSDGLAEELIARRLALHGQQEDVAAIVTALSRGSVLYSAAFLGDWRRAGPDSPSPVRRSSSTRPLSWGFWTLAARRIPGPSARRFVRCSRRARACECSTARCAR